MTTANKQDSRASSACAMSTNGIAKSRKIAGNTAK